MKSQTHLKNLRKQLHSTAGYTIDQTILIVAIIAILITIIIATVGWTLLNRASGTRLAAQADQMGDAITSFYGDFKNWPDSSAVYAAVANFTNGSMLAGASGSMAATLTPKNYLGGLKWNGTNLLHSLGTPAANNIVTFARTNGAFGNTGSYIVVQFANVPVTDVFEAEEALDGKNSTAYGSGRLVAVTTGNTCSGATAAITTNVVSTSTTGNVVACYAAVNTQ